MRPPRPPSTSNARGPTPTPSWIAARTPITLTAHAYAILDSDVYGFGVSFDPATEAVESFPLPGDPGEVRQIHGRPGEVWLPESAADRLVVLRTG